MFTLNCKGELLTITKPIVMGIINTSPNSFYTNSQQNSIDSALFKVEQMVQEGAIIIDIGGQSTKPNSLPITVEEELRRTVNVIEAIKKKFSNLIISIDTYNATVASKAVEAGASIVNDISGGTFDKNMMATVANMNVPYVCMHIKGTPQTMQQNPIYDNVTQEVLSFFIDKINQAKQAGIKDVIIDVGFGFGKTIQHNFQLLKELSVFSILEKPILIGVSRKSTIYKTLGVTPEQALNGTTALHTICLLNGANILRVHDVKEAIECIKLFEMYSQ
ncbi:MAG TPA: dihydropteroate synthase [Chitinophagaceae bacterium]|nr:dihydropteroate synthase [Chitinophagaceae bacterium]HMZ45778.1 dihydropteroate synthase [Chitinophagaceae bacterium]HNE93383.1 dihydropteroate synthase [Chitinophagaceae bacterium]HNF29232.1 dihydropteroate synthase [Chitinophagaceae bacterium]HNJ58524.1 dihydropteroate synthase [Chitinophagaceae bacterium]